MSHSHPDTNQPPTVKTPPPGARYLKRFWIRIRGPLANSRLVNWLLPKLIANYLRLVDRTNPWVAESGDPFKEFFDHAPAILALWHGQHIMVPTQNPHTVPVTGMFSRSADAELNARVAAELGLGVVRGSGGRSHGDNSSKGGARALIVLKNELAKGNSVAMIADVDKSRPREAGLGIVTLARLTGRPVIGAAYASSRRHVIEKSWDKTTINLPFGRSAFIVAKPVFVPRDADDELLEQKRREVTENLNSVTQRAYALVDGKS